MRCDAMRCDTMRCDAMRCDAMRCDAMQCDAMQCDAMRCDAIRFDSIQYNAIQCYAILTKKANKPPLWCLVRHAGTDKAGKKRREKRETSSTLFAHTSFMLHPFLHAL